MSDYNVPLLGIVNVPIKTLTNAYTPVSGSFQFDQKNIQPIDMKYYEDVNNNFLAMQANIISRTQVTRFNVGTPSGSALAAGNAAISWTPDNNCIAFGRIKNVNSIYEPWGGNATVPLNGSTVSIGSLATHLQALPNVANSVTPASFYNWGGNCTMDGGGYGSVYSWTTNLNDFYAKWNGGASQVSATANPAAFNNLTSWLANIPGAGGTDTVYMQNSLGSPPQIFQVYDIINVRPNLGHETVSLIDPATHTISIENSWWNANIGVFQPTVFGLLSIFKGQQTFNGVTNTQGWGVLVRNDFSGYYLLNITGTDGNTTSWAPVTGSVFACIDWNGDLHMKQANNNTLLMISNSAVNLQPQTTQQLGNLGILAVPHSDGLFP